MSERKMKAAHSAGGSGAPKNAPTNAPTNIPTNAPTNAPMNIPANAPARGGLGTHSFSQRLAQRGLDLLPAFFLCLALQGPLFALLDLPFNPLSQSLRMLLFLALWGLLTWGRYNLLASGTLLAVAGLYAWLSGRLVALSEWRAAFHNLPIKIRFALEPGVEIAQAAFPELSDREVVLRLESWRQALVLVVLLLIALLAYLIAARMRFPLLAGGLVFALAIACIAFDRQKNALYLFFVFPAMSCLLSGPEPGRHYVEGEAKLGAGLKRGTLALLLAGLALPLALLFAASLPDKALHSESLYWLVDDAVALLPDDWKGERSFEAYSIAQAGYYPREDALGGPVELSTAPLLKVQGRTAPLLRSLTNYEYSGHSWQRGIVTESWRWGNGFVREKQKEAFSERPLLASIGGPAALSLMSDCEATLLQNQQQALFVPAGLTAAELPDLDAEVFFTEDGLLYASQLLNAQSRYRFKAETPLTERVVIALESAGMTAKVPDAAVLEKSAVLQAALQLPQTALWQPGGLMDAYAHLIADGKLLPDADEGEAFALLNEEQSRRSAAPAESDAINPLLRALRLQTYLKSGVYTLTPAVPPEDSDFVEAFIRYDSESRMEGYCVYYATAMTVMARSLGIPARYVEGLVLSSDALKAAAQNGVVLTGQQAHAWCELYFEGLGWLSFDPTPGGAAPPNESLLPEQMTTESTTTPASTVAASPTPKASVNQSSSSSRESSPGEKPTMPPDEKTGGSKTLFIFLLILLPLFMLGAAGAQFWRYWGCLTHWPSVARLLRREGGPVGMRQWLHWRGRAPKWLREEAEAGHKRQAQALHPVEGSEGGALLRACLLRTYGREIRALLEAFSGERLAEPSGEYVAGLLPESGGEHLPGSSGGFLGALPDELHELLTDVLPDEFVERPAVEERPETFDSEATPLRAQEAAQTIFGPEYRPALAQLLADLEALSFGPPRALPDAVFQNAAALMAALQHNLIQEQGAFRYFFKRIVIQFGFFGL